MGFHLTLPWGTWIASLFCGINNKSDLFINIECNWWFSSQTFPSESWGVILKADISVCSYVLKSIKHIFENLRALWRHFTTADCKAYPVRTDILLLPLFPPCCWYQRLWKGRRSVYCELKSSTNRSPQREWGITRHVGFCFIILFALYTIVLIW